MTLIGIILLVLLIAVVGAVSYWIITTFFPEPAKTVALAIVGVLLLLLLLSQLFPEVAGMRVWK